MPLPLLLALACGPADAPQLGALRINEVMAGNDGLVLDDSDPVCPESDDWVELVNAGDAPVDLRGVTLSDSERTAWLAHRAQSLAPGQTLLLWADEQPQQGLDHLPFRIDADGERLELRRDGVAIDTVDVPAVPRDRSWARLVDGTGAWAESTTPTPGAPNARALPDEPCFAPPSGFHDHTYPCIDTDEGFVALAGDRAGDLSIVKFTIFAFDRATDRRIAFHDTTFYTLHDQLYLFTTFNGEPFEGFHHHRPIDAGPFATWGALDAWARASGLVGIDDDQARYVGERLYSPYFYREVNGIHRHTGVGTLLHRPATDEADALWAFELEYADDIDYDALVTYFEVLTDAGPPGLAELQWLVRSPEQEALAERMQAEGLAYADRVIRYDELSSPGEVEVYHPGLAAGRVRILDGGDALEQAVSTDVLVLTSIPDELPPCAALITTVPQTELSHVSLLAASRGIPNLHVAGLHLDPQWDAWNRRPTWVALQATADGGFVADDIAVEDYALWSSLQQQGVGTLPTVDPQTLPYTIDLSAAEGMLALRPQVGGKASGMRLLLDVDGIDVPDTPLALTVRGYHRHMSSFPWLPELLEGPPFDDPLQVPQRYLLLHGRDAFDARYPDPIDQQLADAFLDAPPTPLAGQLAADDGLVGRIARLPMPSDTHEALTTALHDHFAWLRDDVGLRVRSSSTVEDLEGFHGAGLYTSASGVRADGDDDVSAAIREVWASYWGAEAYEEREAAGIDHLDGGMGLLVHPSFDDAYEAANAVLTATRLPDGSLRVLLNAQHGATPVANPPGTCPPVRPERLRLSDADGALLVERLEASSLVMPGMEVIDDATAARLFEQAGHIVDAWIDTENAAEPPERARSVLTLDLELKLTTPGWPQGDPPARTVFKQARSLDPGLGALPHDIAALPAPVDVLARADLVEQVVCTEPAGGELSIVQLYTDPLASPTMGYESVPLVVMVVSTDEGLSYTHLDLEASQVGDDAHIVGPMGLELTGIDCSGSTLWAAPDRFLLDLLPPLDDDPG
jgi:hypothetical protein